MGAAALSRAASSPARISAFSATSSATFSRRLSSTDSATGAARNAYSRHFAPFESFIFAGLIYILLTLVLVGTFRLAERYWLAHLQPRKARGGQN